MVRAERVRGAVRVGARRRAPAHGGRGRGVPRRHRRAVVHDGGVRRGGRGDTGLPVRVAGRERRPLRRRARRGAGGGAARSDGRVPVVPLPRHAAAGALHAAPGAPLAQRVGDRGGCGGCGCGGRRVPQERGGCGELARGAGVRGARAAGRCGRRGRAVGRRELAPRPGGSAGGGRGGLRRAWGGAFAGGCWGGSRSRVLRRRRFGRRRVRVGARAGLVRLRGGCGGGGGA